MLKGIKGQMNETILWVLVVQVEGFVSRSSLEEYE
jgi:hypothetical protein